MSVTAAARQLTEVVERICRRNESALLLKKGEPVARIVPVSVRPKSGGELARLWAALPHLSRANADAFAADLATSRRKLPLLRSQWE